MFISIFQTLGIYFRNENAEIEEMNCPERRMEYYKVLQEEFKILGWECRIHRHLNYISTFTFMQQPYKLKFCAHTGLIDILPEYEDDELTCKDIIYCHHQFSEELEFF